MVVEGGMVTEAGGGIGGGRGRAARGRQRETKSTKRRRRVKQRRVTTRALGCAETKERRWCLRGACGHILTPFNHVMVPLPRIRCPPRGTRFRSRHPHPRGRSFRRWSQNRHRTRQNVLVACLNRLDMGMILAMIPPLYRSPGPPHPAARAVLQSIAPDGSSDGKRSAGVW